MVLPSSHVHSIHWTGALDAIRYLPLDAKRGVRCSILSWRLVQQLAHHPGEDAQARPAHEHLYSDRDELPVREEPACSKPAMHLVVAQTDVRVAQR